MLKSHLTLTLALVCAVLWPGRAAETQRPNFVLINIDDLGDQLEFLPRRQGFDYYYGLPYSNDMGPGEDGTKRDFGNPPLPTDRKLDGVDLWPVLSGDPASPPRDTFLYHRGLLLEAVRSGPWKLHLATRELYHLATDLGEANNVAAQNPDVVSRLLELADSTKGDLGLDGAGPGCRPLGRVDHPQPLIANDGTVRADVAGTTKRFP